MEPAIMQREDERARIVVTGKRTDDGARCTLVAIHKIGGTWSLYPHGASQLGVRLTEADAATLAHAILGGGSQ
jgi:hypothetical protein